MNEYLRAKPKIIHPSAVKTYTILITALEKDKLYWVIKFCVRIITKYPEIIRGYHSIPSFRPDTIIKIMSRSANMDKALSIINITVPKIVTPIFGELAT
jgi:hypothetical protein